MNIAIRGHRVQINSVSVTLRVMPLYELSHDALRPLPRTTFLDARIQERQDLQRLLRDSVEVIADDVLIVAEEFGAFQDSRRRIDLLGVDHAGRVVVLELKRTEDGGHMELQALRYAAMVAAMTFENIVDAHEAYLRRLGRDASTARTSISAWLTDADEDATLSADVRIVLVSANFDAEITTTVLWLNSFDRMDVRCVRLVPYLLEGRIVLDVQQLVPLPEAADYQIRIREKVQETRAIQARTADGRDWTAYVVTSPSGDSEPLRKRRAVLHMVRELQQAGIGCDRMATVLQPNRFAPVDGTVDDAAAASALVQQHDVADPGWWFIGSDEVLHEAAGTWILSKRWNRHSVEAALASLAGLAEKGFGSHAVVTATPGPAGEGED